MIKKTTLCALPWKSIATSPSGVFRVCCNSLFDNKITNKEGKYFKIGVDNISKVINEESIVKLRKQMLLGEEPDICRRCFNEEKNGIFSARQSANKLWGIDDIKNEKTTLKNIKYLDLRLGSLCNLQCIMCNPISSSQWIKDWNKLNRQIFNDNEIQNLKNNINWSKDNKKLLENLYQILPYVKMIYFTGGEPTLLDAHYNLLDLCINENLAKNITLKYNTNLTNIPNRLINLWKNFKTIKLNISLDGVNELNHYIRYPSNWKLIEKNLKKIDIIENINLIRSIHTTVMAYNVFYLPELFDYLKQFNNIRKIPYLNILITPEFMQANILPKKIKNKTIKKINNWLEENKKNKYNEIEKQYFLKIEKLLIYLKNSDYKEELFITFQNETKKLDKLHKIKLETVASIFKGII